MATVAPLSPCRRCRRGDHRASPASWPPLVAETPCPCCSPLSLSLPYFSSPAGTETLAELPLLPASGRRTLPSPPAAPGLAIAAMSSASSSSTSSSTRACWDASHRGNRRRLPRLGPPPPGTIPSPPSLFRPPRPRHRTHGEQAHLPDPLALPLSLSFLLTVHAVVLRRGHGRRRIFRRPFGRFRRPPRLASLSSSC